MNKVAVGIGVLVVAGVALFAFSKPAAARTEPGPTVEPPVEPPVVPPVVWVPPVVPPGVPPVMPVVPPTDKPFVPVVDIAIEWD